MARKYCRHNWELQNEMGLIGCTRHKYKCLKCRKEMTVNYVSVMAGIDQTAYIRWINSNIKRDH